MEKKDLTASVYTFEKLRTADYLYIDKTEYIWNLIRLEGGMYFLSRPRRFGKSLTISTLEAIFQGKRELFKGLAIYDKPYDWKTYPVIHLDMNQCDTDKVDLFIESLQNQLGNIAKSAGVALRGSNLKSQFVNLITDMSAGDQQVVILIDEYDKPILNNISKSVLPKIFQILKSFYSTIKSCNAQERFVFITGVSKFCHVSIFSDLNNLLDISMNADYATMLGYTQKEFEDNFAAWIDDAVAKQVLPRDKYLAEIKSWYDGYKFHAKSESVYNPVSLANFFINGGEFRNYWFETGTPTFLLDLIKSKRMNLEQVISEPTTPYTFGSFEINDVPPLMLLLQTGYLTIKSAVTSRNCIRYMLDFSNREVSESFNVHLLNAYAHSSQNDVANFCDHLCDAIETGDLPKFQKSLEVFFAGIPYDVHRKSEANFQNIFFAIFKLLGFNIHAESRTSDGRIDAIIETDSNIYLFEFKLNKDDSALAQIKEKEYFKPYLLSQKKITLVGANFDTDTGKLSDWQTEMPDA